MKKRVSIFALGLMLVGCASRHPVGPSPTPAPSATTAAAPPTPGLTSTQGRLAPETIQKIVRTNLPSMKKCYDEGVTRNPKLRGTVTTKFVIGADGLVQSSEATTDANHPPFPDPKVEACILKTFTALVFPKPQGGTVTVTYPLVFTPEDRE